MLDKNIEGSASSGNASRAHIDVDAAWRKVCADAQARTGAVQPVVVSAVREHPAVAFLRAYDPDGRHNLVAFDPSGGPPKGRTFRPGDWAAMAEWIAERDGRKNLYFSANEPGSDAPNDKLTKHHIARLRAVYTDTDPRKGEPLEEERARLMGLVSDTVAGPIPPTFAIDSGGGVQMFWQFPEKLEPSDRALEAECQGRGLARHFEGDKVQNIDRIMRLPGTMNLPTADKLAKGRTARRSTLIHTGGPLWTLEKLAAVVPPVGGDTGGQNSRVAGVGPCTPGDSAASNPRVAEVQAEIKAAEGDKVGDYEALPPGLRERFEAACRKSPVLAQLWDGEPPRDDTSGSGYRAKLAVQLVHAGGFTHLDFAHLVWAWDYAVQPGHDRKEKLTPRALARDWVNVGERADPVRTFGEFGPDAVKETDAAKAAQDAAATTPGMEPVDIFGDADPAELAELPPGCLPAILEPWVRDIARRTGTPAAFSAFAGLSVIAAAIGSSLMIRPKLYDERQEPAALWAILVADPGSAKSPVIKMAMEPLRRLDRERYLADKPAHEAWEAKRKPKGVPKEPEPRIRRCVVDDATMEKQVRIHADNPRGIIRATDEFVGLLGSLGAYKRGAQVDRSLILRLFDGGHVMVDRVGGGNIHANDALMGVLAGTQPDVIRKLARDLDGDGLLQRCLFVVHDGRRRQEFDELPDHVAANAYADAVRTLGVAQYDDKIVRLSSEAYDVLKRGETVIQSLGALPGASKAWQGHVSKWGKILPRITLIFHALDHVAFLGEVLPGTKVEKATAEKAVLFARFAVRHSLRFYEEFYDARDETSEARKIAGYILTKPDKDRFTRRDIYDARTNLRGDENTRALNSAMGELESAGWVTAEDRGQSGPKSWMVNPLVRSRFADRAKWEREDRERGREQRIAAGKARRALNSDNLSDEED